MKQFIITNLLLLTFLWVKGQEHGILCGRITDSEGKPVAGATIAAKGTSLGTTTNDRGDYELKLPAGKPFTVVYSFTGFLRQQLQLTTDTASRTVQDIILIAENQELSVVNIIDNSTRTNTVTRIDPRITTLLPDASGNAVENLLKTMLGVSSANELSAQYSVRGGNFDENLVYVNDIEVYRPVLIRSGQQEGMSFINPALVSSIKFSAGGFEAKYGDKMSSVLDVRYKKPRDFESSVYMSLLGAGAHLGGLSRNGRFSHISGIRYKTNRYLLNSLETTGEYYPDFIDFQTYMSYRLSGSLEISVLGNYASNQYRFIPYDRSTVFGSFDQSLNLYVDFEGQENNRYQAGTAVGALSWMPSQNAIYRLTASFFRTLESETFDVEGRYSLNVLDKDLTSDTFGDSVLSLGIGGYIDHARNMLEANIYSIGQTGAIHHNGHFTEYGIKYTKEYFDDHLNEWRMIDSADYSIPPPGTLPYPGKELIPYPDSIVRLFETLNADNLLDINRFSAYLQDRYSFSSQNIKHSFHAGLRLTWDDYSARLSLNPRLTWALEPNWKRDVVFRFSAGAYYQPATYKELRSPDGELAKNILPQRSLHLLAGTDFNFAAWQRPFKFVGEIYYKAMDRLIPYETDNVRIRYFPQTPAKGYATGIDLKINGEFVSGVDSWASLSLMTTRQDVEGDAKGYLPKPTDQRVNFSVFFQDYIPGNRTYTMTLGMHYGSGIPFGYPGIGYYNVAGRLPSYRRVDLGFTKIFVDRESNISSRSPLFKPFNQCLLSLEIFNLLGIENTISYSWIMVVPNSATLTDVPLMYAVPNRLTSRRINVRILFTF